MFELPKVDESPVISRLMKWNATVLIIYLAAEEIERYSFFSHDAASEARE
jgi:hypothetical protein